MSGSSTVQRAALSGGGVGTDGDAVALGGVARVDGELNDSKIFMIGLSAVLTMMLRYAVDSFWYSTN